MGVSQLLGVDVDGGFETGKIFKRHYLIFLPPLNFRAWSKALISLNNQISSGLSPSSSSFRRNLPINMYSQVAHFLLLSYPHPQTRKYLTSNIFSPIFHL